MTRLDDDPATTRERLNTIGWGLVFLLIGALAMPNGPAVDAAVAVIGGLMLGLNLVLNATYGRVDVFSLALGVTALLAGLGGLAGVRLDALALFFVAVGVILVAVPVGRLAAAQRRATGTGAHG